MIMSRVPMGKVLLRNVIRHTDAHNKIQEESEMWKLRDMELQSPSPHASKHRWMTSSHLARNNMHCDRYLDDSEGSVLGKKKCLSEKDDREARYWTRKLYEFEANDPDRWGHSGFKELYPDEFQSDGETDCTKRSRKNGKEKTASDRRKNSKKSSKRKKKKKKKRQRTEGSGSESDHSTSDCVRRKQKRKSGKSKRSRKKEHKSKVREDEDSSTEDSEAGRSGEIAHRKRHRTAADGQTEPERKKRKNWKANEEKSEESSED